MNDHTLTPVATPGDRNERLAAWAATCMGVGEVHLRGFLGGASNLGFEVRLHRDDPTPVAFLRTKLGDDEVGLLGYTLHREGVILQVAAELGFPVAPVLGTLRQPDALLMGYVHGTARPAAAEIEEVAPKYLALIARVHSADATRFPVQQHATVRQAVGADFTAWHTVAGERGVLDEPLLALAGRVLREQMPPGDGPPSLVHGDVGAGNFLALDGEVSAMLDWELAHLGDPHEDLAWLWMRGAHTSFGDPATRFAEYQAASGLQIDHERLAWHVAFVMWKSAISLHGRLRSVVPGELAMVQLIVALTYDVLLGTQLVRVLGGPHPLQPEEPHRGHSPPASLADELLGVATLAADQRVVLEYLRDAAALAPWQQRQLAAECHTLLGIAPEQLLQHVQQCTGQQLPAVAAVLARDADRRAAASPKSVRRIERAQNIGLGTA